MSEEQIENLANSILYHKRKYYDAEPEISDAEYDALEDRLRELDPKNPVLFIVGTPEGGKVEHNPPMLSSDKATNLEDVVKWAQKMKGDTLTAGYKVDGLSLSLVYTDKNLIQAATRGNGEFGDDVTLSVMKIDDIPKTIPLSSRVNIRGEVYMMLEDFEKINSELDEEDKYASPRNLAAGTIKQKDATLVKDRRLHFKAFDMIVDDSEQSIEEISSNLKEWGFDIADKDIIKDWTPEKLELIFRQYEGERDTIGFEIDGVIFKYNAFNDREEAGQTEHHPKWQIAWKFQSKGATTKVNGITWQVGRSSVLTPVAELDPVEIAGATIKRATMHNADFVQNMDINIGDIVSITRSGDVIPKIISVEEKLGDEFELPKTCPSCGNPTERIGVNLVCTGDKCRERDIQTIIHWLRMVEVDNIGPKSVEKLYDNTYIMDFADLYKPELNGKLLVELFGKNGEKMFESLNKGKELELHKLLAGLGIPILGKKLGKTLANHFGSLEKILSATEEDLIQLEGISTVSAKSIVSGLTNNKQINKLLENDVQIVLKQKSQSRQKSKKSGLDAFFGDGDDDDDEDLETTKDLGLKIYVTGSVEGLKKKEIQETVEKLGFEWSTSISRNLNLLVYGNNAGQAKIDKAKQLGIELLTWDQFINKYSY